MSYPDYTRNPNDSDVQTFLTAAAMWDTSYAAVNVGLAAAAVDEFQNVTGRIPFLGKASNADYYFDAPDTRSGMNRLGNLVFWPGVPFVSIAAIAYGCTPADQVGHVLTIGTDVFLGPENYALKGLPIEELVFVTPITGDVRSLRINGKAGSFATWPEDAWHAVVMGATAKLATTVSAVASGGVTTIKDGDQTVTNDGDPFGTMRKTWEAAFAAAKTRYTLIRAEE